MAQPTARPNPRVAAKGVDDNVRRTQVWLRDIEDVNLRAPTHTQGTWRPSHVRTGTDESGMKSRGCLWLRFDDPGYVDDRMFRKDVFPDEDDWRDPALWAGDVYDFQTRQPNELATHTAMNNQWGVVRLRETMQDRSLIEEANMRYRVYTAWAPYGSLWDLVIDYTLQQENIPEPFIWYVAENLIGSGRSMGNLIVHRDYKVDNVFLAENHARFYRTYPTPVLGDFGLAFFAEDNAGNPRWYQDVGTVHCYAPEQRKWLNPDTYAEVDSWVMDEKTNVFGVGLVLWCLVQRLVRPKEPAWRGADDPDATLRLPFPHERHYSNELITFINWCLRFWPNNRPTFDQLLQLVQWNTSDQPNAPNLALGMRDGRFDEDDVEQQLLRIDGDKYHLGLSWDQVEGYRQEAEAEADHALDAAPSNEDEENSGNERDRDEAEVEAGGQAQGQVDPGDQAEQENVLEPEVALELGTEAERDDDHDEDDAAEEEGAKQVAKAEEGSDESSEGEQPEDELANEPDDEPAEESEEDTQEQRPKKKRKTGHGYNLRKR